MVTYLRPDVYIEEEVDQRRPIRGVGTAITGIMGIAQKGPVGVPVFVTGETDYKRVFGDYLAGESLTYAVAGFFKNGGAGAWILRLAHYTDLVAGTIAAAAASANADGLEVSDYAEFTGNVDVTTVVLQDGWSFDLDVNGSGDDTVTVQAVPAVVDGAAGTFVSADANTTADYKVNGGPTKSLTFLGVADGVANYINAANAQMEEVSVEDNGGQLRVTSDREGSSARIQFLNLGSNFAAISGISAGTVASPGPNNVSNSDAVTFAEVKTMIEDAVKTAVAGDKVVATQQAGTGFMVLTATMAIPGPTSELDLSSGTAELLAALGVTGLGSQGANPTVTGSATASAVSLVISSGYRGYESPGLHGNDYYVEIVDDPKFESAGVGLDLADDAAAAGDSLSMTSITGINEGSYLKLVDGATVEYVKVMRTETTIVGGTVVHMAYLTDNLVNTFLAASSTVVSLEHTLTVYDVNDQALVSYTQFSMNPDVDNYAETVFNDSEVGSIYVTVVDQLLAFPGNVLDALVKTRLSGGTSETAGFVVNDILGDETGKTGVYAFDEVDDVNFLTAPPSHGGVTTIPANAVVQNQMLLYCGNRMDMFAILDLPGDNPYTQAVNYRNNTLGADSYWGAIYYPHLEVPDPLGSGSNPTVLVPPSGHICGLAARVDNLPNGGVSEAFAGTGDYGKLRNVVGLEYLIGNREHNVLNPAGINTIRNLKKGGTLAPGIVVMGGRTLSTLLDFRYIPVRRTMTFAEQSIRLGTLWTVFRPNTFKTWGQAKDQIEDFLERMLRAGQLAGRTLEEAFFVKIDDETTTVDDVDNGRMIGEVGLALKKPAEFVIWRFAQFQGGSEINEG
jgi:phage tail sheath protein FI